MTLSVLSLTLALCAPSELAAADDLAALTSPDAGARELATRRLCGSLSASQRAALLELSVGADFELERRITRIVAAEEERLGLAVTLLGSRDKRARAIGRASFHELLVRWEPDYDDPPLPSHKANALLRESQLGLFFVPPCEGENIALLERLAEGVNLGAPLVIDPSVDGREGAWGSAEGSPLEHLKRMCLDGGLSYELRGPESVDGVVHPALGHWLRLCSARDATGAPTLEVLISWALEVSSGGGGGARAARALATTGWTAPLAWFEERWRSERDPVALSGLLAAAARGEVSLALSEAGAHVEARALLERVAGSAWEVERIARGMAEARALAPGGEAPSAAWEAEGASSERSVQWARLLVLEGHGRGDRALAREVLSGEELSDPLLWRRALRAYASDPRRAPLELSVEGVGLVVRGAHRDGLARTLYLAGLRASDLKGLEGAELLEAELSLRAGDDELCAASFLEAWRAELWPVMELEALLSSWCSELGRARVALALSGVSLEGDERGAWMRLLELAGVLTPGASGASVDDLELIACRAGQREGALVRSLLLEELEALDLEDRGRLEEFARAWQRVGWALQEAGDAAALKSFGAQTRLIVRQAEAQELLLDQFPPSPRGLITPLDVGLLRVDEPR